MAYYIYLSKLLFILYEAYFFSQTILHRFIFHTILLQCDYDKIFYI